MADANDAGTSADANELNARVISGKAGVPVAPKGAKTSLLADLENKDDVLKVVLARALQAAQYRRPFEEEWHRGFLAMFQVFATELEGGWQSQRYMPLILSNVETAYSVVGAVVIGNQKLCRFQAKTPEGRDCAKAHEALLDWQNMGPAKIARKILGSEWWALVTGTAMVDTGWEFEEGMHDVPVVEADAMTGKKTKVIRQQKVTVADHPFVKELNPLDVYLCPHAGVGTEHPWVVMRVRTTLGDVKAAQDKGCIDRTAVTAWIEESKPTDTNSNPGGFDSHLGSKLLDLWLGEVGKTDQTSAQKDDSADPASDDKIVELLVYRSTTETIVLGSTTRIIGYAKNAFVHRKVGIVTSVFIPIKGCPYGRSLAGLLLGHQELLNANVNIFADALYVSMMRPMVVDRSLISILDDEAIFEPNAMLRARMNARDAIVPLDIPAPTNLFMLWDGHLKKDADDTGGFTEQSRGMAPANSPTATEFSGTQANIQNRLKIHVLRLQWYIEDVCTLVSQLNSQFYTQEEVVSVIGEDGMGWRTIEPWELVGQVLCQATTSPKYANPDLHVQRQLQILQILIPLLSQGQMNPAIVKLLRGILRAANTDDLDQILPAGMETVKSWRSENQAMLRGLSVKPTIAEVRSGQSSMHIDGHSMFLQELAANPNVPADVIDMVTKHINDHHVLEQQFGEAAAMAQGGGQPALPGGTGGMDPTRQGASAMGQAQGSAGVPGEASPGPTGPLNRPMGA